MVTAMRGDRARRALRGTRFGEVRWVEETGSTNRDLAESARAGEADGAVLVADYQSSGRGRRDRGWEAPPDASLLVSVLVRPSTESAETGLITVAMAVSAVEACSLIAPFGPGIKWPNDLIVVSDDSYDGLKLGGVLAEGVADGGRIGAVVAGLGLNVNWSRELPEDLRGIAVGLSELVGHEVDREDLLIELLRRMDRWMVDIQDESGRERLMERYRQVSATIGRMVRVTMPDEEVEGHAVDVTGNGYLLVQVEGEASPREVVAADVVHLRHS